MVEYRFMYVGERRLTTTVLSYSSYQAIIYNLIAYPTYRSDPTVKEVVTDLASSSPFTDRFSGRTPDCGSGDAISIIADLTSILFLFAAACLLICGGGIATAQRLLHSLQEHSDLLTGDAQRPVTEKELRQCPR